MWVDSVVHIAFTHPSANETIEIEIYKANDTIPLGPWGMAHEGHHPLGIFLITG
jgi:hypothetical protein